MKNPSTLLLSFKLQQICNAYYEKGRNNRSKKAVWQNHILKEFQISYRTFLRHLNADATHLDEIIKNKEDAEAEKLRSRLSTKRLHEKIKNECQ